MKTLTIEIPEPGDDPARMAADAAPAGVHDDSPLETSKADARPWSPSPFYGTPAAPATTRGGWFIDAGQSNIGALWQQVEAGTDGAVWLSSALSADVPALPEPDINTVNHASVRIVGYSSEAARAYGAACRTAAPAAPSVPPLPDDTIAAALADPACTRLREWAAIGPVQRAAVQSFADRLAAAPSVPAGWVDAVMEQAQVFASAWSLVGSPFDDGDALGTANEEKEALRAMLAAAPHPAGGVE